MHCRDAWRVRHYCRCSPPPTARWLSRTCRNIPFLPKERRRVVTSSNTAKESGIRRSRRSRAVRVGAAASGLVVVLGCVATGPAVASPNATRLVHVEGHVLPVAESPGVYQVTGGLVGIYKIRSERVIHAWTYWTTQIREIEGTESITGWLCRPESERELRHGRAVRAAKAQLQPSGQLRYSDGPADRRRCHSLGQGQ